ncbi:MAG: hypothetical protein DI537_47115 [Stutzerimonas stutzeri]|nr:MAG: hypothetical protein DI537_47115 [Stutzerimonas stutzeri]
MRSRLSRDQIAALPTIVETGTDRMIEGVVRWRRIDLKRTSRGERRAGGSRRHADEDAWGIAGRTP